MRKLIARSVLALLTVVVFSSAAAASPIAIGTFSFVVDQYDAQGVPLEGHFSILNLSGAGFLPPDFPVATQLVFDSLNVAVDGGSGGGGSDIAQASMSSFGFSFDSAAIDLTTSWPMSAALTGNVTPLLVTLAGGGQWQINGGGAIFTGPLGQLGDGATPIDEFALPEIIYVDAEQVQQVPEPGLMFLFGSGAVGVLAMRRRSRTA